MSGNDDRRYADCLISRQSSPFVHHGRFGLRWEGDSPAMLPSRRPGSGQLKSAVLIRTFRSLVVGYEPCAGSSDSRARAIRGASAHDGLQDQLSDDANDLKADGACRDSL